MYPIYIPISGNGAHGMPNAYMDGMKPMQPFMQPMQPAVQPIIYQTPPDMYQSPPPPYTYYPAGAYPTASGPYVAMPAPTVSVAQQGVYGGIQNHGVQQYLPISEKRQLDPQEDVNTQKGLKRWWPKIGAGYATPMHELLADPYKSAAISALLLGVLAGLAGLLMQPRRLFAMAGIILGSFIGAFSGYINRRQQNENILDLMQRFPQGATKRDMLSDPVYQSDLNRAAMARASSGGGGDMLAGALIGSAFSSGYGNRRS